ncbi:MAG: hypothetical protein J2P50_12460 [Hyphomicrobiaceae bacterium]|nr:hypothetical protein [Hyphomicrobiaceae bacterium]
MAPASSALLERKGDLAESGIGRLLLVPAAFVLYWVSALILESRGGTTHFGADAHLYTLLADGYVHERVARFHPVTTTLAVVWLRALSPLTAWFSTLTLLKALFAAVGALGVWGAMAAFAAVVPRRFVALLGVIYAVSFSVWFFSGVEESKIVSATLTAFYIAAYMRLRRSWSVRGALLLTGILLVACLNEIVAGFLVVIPAVDALVKKGWRLSGNWWIGWHALTAPLALVFLEVAVNGWLVKANADPEGASHLSMLLYYVTQNRYGLGTVVDFVVRWLFYSIAAPALDAGHGARTDYAGDYGPDVTVGSYFSSPISAGMAILFGAIVAACVLPRYRRACRDTALAGMSQALIAYALLRAAFFFAVYPGECLIFSASTTLAHMLLLAMPFTASAFPRKEALLAAFAALLFVVNATFIIGQ